MTTYRTPEGSEYAEYTKFARNTVPCGITWIPLEVAHNRVRFFDLSQLREVVDPRLTGMVYDKPAIPQNFDSGLDYIYPLPYVKPVVVCLPASSMGEVGKGRGKNKRPTIPGMNPAQSLHVIVIKPVSLWHESMGAVA